MATKTKVKTELLKGLNKEQEKAVTFKNGPLLIIAGAGTGKTTVLTRRIVWLIEQGLAKPEEILALTFTEKAATEMEERVDLLMPLGYAELNISTFHAFAQKILSQHALDIGIPGDFKVLTQTQAWMLVKKNLQDFDLNYYKPIGNPNRFIHALIQHFHKAKGEEVTPEAYLEYAQKLQLAGDSVEVKKKTKRKSKNLESGISNLESDPAEAARVMEVANAYHVYQKLLLDNSFLDFGDIINYTLKLFRERPKVLAHYQKQFKYVLVDEFQDTDLAQYELVKMLSLPENNITVVGDDDQSIYKFRGASISNILKFQEDYPQAKEVTLVENYRSIPQILDLAYGFIQQNNPERLEAKLKISKKLISPSNDTGEIAVLHAPTAEAEANLVADKILELHQKESLSFNDFAILSRSNDAAECFLNELAARGIPHIFVAQRGLYKKPFILDILAYLRLLDNYHEGENMIRVLNLPKFKIPEEHLISFFHTAKRRAMSVYEAAVNVRNIMSLPGDSVGRIEDLVRMIGRHTSLAQSIPVSELLVRILEDLDLTMVLLQDTTQNVENRNLIEQFYRKAQSFETSSDDKSLKAFLNQIRLELEAGDQGDLAFSSEAGPEAVKVMTVHSAKGLEFACVFVVNMADQRFPSRSRSEPIEIPQELVKEILPEGDAHLMEERRLFYVAATRAKRFLYLTWADNYGGAQDKKPSRFLVELGLEEKKAKDKPKGEVFFVKQKPLIEVKQPLVLPDTFSFSQISSFRHCPLEYKLRYIYHLPLPGEAQLSFGITIHKTLEKFLKGVIQLNSQDQPDLFGSKKTGEVKIPDKKLLQKFYEECWVDDWFASKFQKEDYRKQGLRLLDNFYQRYSQNPRLPKFLEKPFKLKLGDYKFVGKIDRGDFAPDGSIEIVDYKTGQAKEKLSPVDKQQLLIYQWAAQEQFEEKIKSLRYWYLTSTEESIEFLGGPEEIEDMKKKLLETIEEIHQTIRTNGFTAADHRISHDCKYRHLQ